MGIKAVLSEVSEFAQTPLSPALAMFHSEQMGD